jgi:hypothetical protein
MIFTTPIFFNGPVLGGAGTVLDGVSWLVRVFSLLAVGFLVTSAFRLSLAALEASLPRSGHGA